MRQSQGRQPYLMSAMSLVLMLALGGCGSTSQTLASAAPRGLPSALAGSTVTDPKLAPVAEQFQSWILSQESPPDRQPLFSRVEILPVTLTVLPYGVGANQQEPRLPVIVTTGPGWTRLTPDQKEQQIARVYHELVDRLGRSDAEKRLRPTLTLQTPQGIVLSWINEITDGRKLIYGDGG